MMTVLEEKIKEQIIKTMDLDGDLLTQADEQTALFASGEEGSLSFNLDSIDTLELLVMLEREWNLRDIPAEVVTSFRTIADIASYITAHSGEK